MEFGKLPVASALGDRSQGGVRTSSPEPSGALSESTPTSTDSRYTAVSEHSGPSRTTSASSANPPVVAAPPDWPVRKEIDLAQQDLPHRSSGVEWWYFNAHLVTPDSQHLGVFGSFFRVVIGQSKEDGSPIHAHFLTWALSDELGGRYFPTSAVEDSMLGIILSRLERGEGTSDPRIRRALAESLQKGSMPRPDLSLRGKVTVAQDRLALDYASSTLRKDESGNYVVRFRGEKASCELTFEPKVAPHRHGRDGVVPGKEGEEMFYYFVPRNEVSGTVMLDGKEYPVKGTGWYDHEFGGHRPQAAGDPQIRMEVAWNWCGVQFNDGSAFTIYELQETKSGKDAGSTAVLVRADGTEARSTKISLEPLRWWRSVRTFESHPTAWALRVPELRIDLTLEAVFDDQELITVLSKPSFWEGQCRVRGSVEGRPVNGLGYFERSGFSFLDSLDDFFRAVSSEVRKSVASLLPLQPTRREALDLFASREHAHFLEGLDETEIAASLVAPLRAITDRGGKAWRSYAALACTEALGADCRPYVKWLSLPEIMHSGSLIVDDVEDRSNLRRGGPPAHALFGEAVAINAGTGAYFLAEGVAMRVEAPEGKQLRLYRLYFEGLRAGHAGQALDLVGFDRYLDEVARTGKTDVLEQRIIGMHRLKTGAPAGILARMGAVAADGRPEQVEGLGRFFENLGIAFQIVDDVLNLKGFKGDLKEVGEDIAAGKITLPVVVALGRLSPEARTEMVRLLRSRPQDPAVIGRIIDSIRETGAFDHCIQLSEKMVDESWREVDPLLPESLWKVMLRAFCWYVLERHY